MGGVPASAAGFSLEKRGRRKRTGTGHRVRGPEPIRLDVASA